MEHKYREGEIGLKGRLNRGIGPGRGVQRREREVQGSVQERRGAAASGTERVEGDERRRTRGLH